MIIKSSNQPAFTYSLNRQPSTEQPTSLALVLALQQARDHDGRHLWEHLRKLHKDPAGSLLRFVAAPLLLHFAHNGQRKLLPTG